jgi:hypothetical protein
MLRRAQAHHQRKDTVGEASRQERAHLLPLAEERLRFMKRCIR